MPAASIILLLMIAFIASRLLRSTKLWWALLSTIMAGLLVGMLGREVIGQNNDNKTSQTQLIKTTSYVDSGCMQSLVTSVESDATICHSGVAGYIPECTERLRDMVLIGNTGTNGRDSPLIEDDS